MCISYKMQCEDFFMLLTRFFLTRGQENTKEKILAFRECFGRLGELRSLAPKSPETPVLALTATATKEVRKDVVKSLGLRKDRVEITISPNRTNIYLYTAKVSDKISESFAWLVEKLRKEGVQMQQTILLFTARA